MTFTTQEQDGCALVRIEGDMSVYEASALRDTFVACFEKYDGLILDLSAVETCDTAGVQLLCAARVTADAEQKSFTIQEMSASVANALRACGLSSEKILKRREEV